MKATMGIAASLALALAACAPRSKPDPYLAAVPDAAALTIDSSSAAVAGVIDPIHVTTFGDDLGVVHARAEALNGGLREVFTRLEEVAASGGAELPGSVKIFGPTSRCVEPDPAGGCVANGEATLRLVVKLFGDTKSGYLLQVQNAGGTWDPVLAGYLLHGALGRRGAGQLWVNLDNLKAVAPGYRGQGQLAAGFAAGPVAKRAGYLMVQFTRDTAQHDPVTAGFRMWKSAAGVVRARVAGFADLDQSGPSPELGFWHGVWTPADGGRSYTIVTNFDSNGLSPGGTVVGDVAPAGTLQRYWFGRACYAPGATVAKFKEWWLCSRPFGPLYCIAHAPETDHQIVIGNAASDWVTECGQDAPGLGAPTGMPPTGPDDVSEEDGEAQAYVDPEPCPSTAQTPVDTSPPGTNGMPMGM
jgi:hypothetical protein